MTQRPLPTIDALQDLLVLVDKEGVTKAAEERNTSQPTMTRHLKAFQLDEGGLDVLEKQGKSLVPTELGRRALPAIQELVQQYDHLMRYFEGVVESPQIVRIGTGSFAAEHYLPRAMADIYRKAVDWELRTSVCRGRHRILGTAQGHFDLSIVTHDPTQIDTMVATKLGNEYHLEVEQIAVQPFCVIARSKSAEGKELAKFATRKTIPPDELTRWKLVGLDRESGIRRAIQRHLVRLKKPNLRFFSQTGMGGWPIAKEYARQGLGVAVLPIACLSPNDAADLTIRRLSDDLVMEDFLIHRADPLTRSQRAVKDALQRAIEQHERDTRRLWKNLV